MSYNIGGIRVRQN